LLFVGASSSLFAIDVVGDSFACCCCGGGGVSCCGVVSLPSSHGDWVTGGAGCGGTSTIDVSGELLEPSKSYFAATSVEVPRCDEVDDDFGFESSHRRRSYAIFDAIFLNPMLVPEIRLNRTPFSDNRGNLHTSISH
jgi:hypothetical protein